MHFVPPNSSTGGGLPRLAESPITYSRFDEGRMPGTLNSFSVPARVDTPVEVVLMAFSFVYELNSLDILTWSHACARSLSRLNSFCFVDMRF